MSTILKLFSAFVFEVTIIGIVVLLIPIAYKLWKRAKKRETLLSIMWSSSIGIIFIFVWIIVGIASSLRIGLLASPYDGTRQLLIAQICQALWIFSGLILSISNRATLGAILGALWGLLSAISAGCVVGFVGGFIIGLIPSIYSHTLIEKLIDAFMVGIFGAVFLSFCAALFISTFTTLCGAVFGFVADTFGESLLYEKLLQRFRVSANYPI